jgi:transcriptional regulator with XRE-family HTH domain
MTTTEQPGFGQAVKADRIRRKMTRKQYAELTGISDGMIQGAESGRRPKKTTVETLLPFTEQLLDDSMIAQGVHEGTYNETIRGMKDGESYEDARARLLARFTALQTRLGGKPAPPYGLPSQYRIDACPPEEWPRWHDWMERVEQYMDGLDAEKAATVQTGESSAPEVPHALPTDTGSDAGMQSAALAVAEQSVAQAREAVGAVFPAVPVWPADEARDDEDEPGLMVFGPGTTNLDVIHAHGMTVNDAGTALVENVQLAVVHGDPQTPLEALLQRSVDAVRAEKDEALKWTQGPIDTIDTSTLVLDPAQPLEAQLPEGAQVLQFPGTADAHRAAIAQPQRQLDQIQLDPDTRYVTNGELQTFKDCRRRWWLEYYRALGSIVEKRTGAAALGTRVHKALAVLYVPEGESPGDALAELDWTVADDRQYLEQNGADERAFHELEREHDLARAMIEGYLQWLEEEAADVGMQVISSERPLVANPGFQGFENVRLLTLEDVRVRMAVDNSTAFLDHKTTQTFQEYETWGHMNPQMKHYGLAEFLAMLEDGLAAGMDPAVTPELRTDGAILNMLRKVRRTANAKPPFYKRHHIRWNTDTLRSYWHDVFGTLQQIEAARAGLDQGADHRQIVAARPTKDCSWKCPFFLECPMFDDGSHVEAMLAETKTTVDPWQRYEPELRGVIAD